MLSDYRKLTDKEIARKIGKKTPETFLKMMRNWFLENEELEFSQKIWTILRDKTTQDLDCNSLEEDASSCVKKLIKKEVEEEIKKKLQEGELITDIKKIKDELTKEIKEKYTEDFDLEETKTSLFTNLLQDSFDKIINKDKNEDINSRKKIALSILRAIFILSDEEISDDVKLEVFKSYIEKKEENKKRD